MWCTDITQHPTGTGTVYCCAVLDVFTRAIVGWSIADHMRTDLVIDAPQMATWRRWPQPGAILHSDRGSQYTSWVFGHRLRAEGLLGSMGRIASSVDNTMMESFWNGMQRELLDTRTWLTVHELASAIFEWIEAWYNPRRRHTNLGMLSPHDYEMLHKTAQPAARSTHNPCPENRVTLPPSGYYLPGQQSTLVHSRILGHHFMPGRTLNESATTSHPSRRTVAKLASWSTPVIAIAAVAPTASASGCPSLTPNSLNYIYYRTREVDTSVSPYVWLDTSYIEVSLADPTATNPSFSVSAATTVTYVIDSYAIKLTYPFRVAWGTEAGWTITESASGIVPNQKFTYTFTALPASLTGTYSSQNSASPTVGLSIPTFDGSTTTAQGQANGWIRTGENAQKSLTVPISRSGSYRVTSGAGCSAASIPISKTGSISIAPQVN